MQAAGEVEPQDQARLIARLGGTGPESVFSDFHTGKGVAGGGDAAADADLKAALGRSRAGEQQCAEQEREEMFHAEISWF
mgnify:CR=1 FL=1